VHLAPTITHKRDNVTCALNLSARTDGSPEGTVPAVGLDVIVLPSGSVVRIR
jgi:hypothetical protein